MSKSAFVFYVILSSSLAQKQGSETSENFPNNYPNSLDKNYTIEADDTFVIEFLSFDLEDHSTCLYDWVRIVDGDGSVLLPKKCGSEIPAPVTTNTNTAVVIFHSDSSLNRPGFRLKWNTVAPVQSGSETSENFPNDYPNSLDKNYTIEADDTFVIEFSSFDLEDHSTCLYDWVRIVDGDGSVLLPKKCGSEIPAPVTTSTNTAVVMFHSDGSETRQGFRLKWNTVAPVQSDCICGEANKEIHHGMKTSRIFGGTNTTVNEYPWMVRVLTSYSALPPNAYGLCGGSLMSDRWIITAAHCVTDEINGDPYKITVELGHFDANTKAMRIARLKSVIHEQYSNDSQLVNDIALLELEDPIDFSQNPHIRPICLPSNKHEDYTGSKATVAGWGRTGNNASASRFLLEADVMVEPKVYCGNREENICARAIANNPQGICEGDSGGPLMTTRPGKNSYTLIGLSSFVFTPYFCMTHRPGGFVEITHFLDWIKEKTKGSNTCTPRIS